MGEDKRRLVVGMGPGGLPREERGRGAAATAQLPLVRKIDNAQRQGRRGHASWGGRPTLRRPCARCACRAASAALFSRQNPIWSLGVAWCPGGRQMLKPTGGAFAVPGRCPEPGCCPSRCSMAPLPLLSPPLLRPLLPRGAAETTASTSATAAHAARMASSKLLGVANVGPSALCKGKGAAGAGGWMKTSSRGTGQPHAAHRSQALQVGRLRCCPAAMTHLRLPRQECCLSGCQQPSAA